VAFRGNISTPVQVTDLVEVSKDVANLLVCTRKKIFCLGGEVFFQWCHGGLLCHLGPLWLALGANS